VAADIDQAESGAKLENGVLTLTLAKRNAPASARITVN
jgi:HSP20 family molecular chaperone IbpA